ncbi:MAG TPA: hypothetical protein VH374_22790 [Polyangia bacterium]|nr:hypothetical protein [Polyangia bacterium]
MNLSLILVGAAIATAQLAQATVSSAALDPVAVEGDDGCPDRAQVQALVNERLAANDGPRVTSGWRLHLDTRKPATPSLPVVVTGTLLDRAGAAHESKELTVAATDCDAAALIFASMVERFFRGLGWSSNAPLPAPAVSSVVPPSLPSPPRWAFGIDLSGGGAALVGGGASAHAVVGAAATATIRDVGRLRLDILGGWPPRHRSEALSDGASASQDSWPLRTALVFSGARRTVAWQAGIDALVTVDRANSGGVVHPGTNHRLTLAAGLTTGIIIAWGAHWSLLGEVAVDRHAAGTRFVIPGDAPPQTIILEPPSWTALFAARAVYSFGQ